MNMIPVRSSAICAIGYDSLTRRMQINFHDSGTYTFCRVPQRIFDGFLSASSKGTYYNRYIRDRYHC
ncbi:hypothetical protein Xen7305DRAFT_00009140 [Xenococcus sp. PCC 7305]|uniref:KTSC domain-containing protein n=1 Tax=Xenococcus sp. PCC 7305 TaxID=102125 RepID=UPI0002ABA47C|nr:hypothetical protein Xen7305DRAFT_00009140 [Xenococcus sp. PCC 7305]